MSVEREVIRRTFMHIRRTGRMLRRVVIVGCNEEALDVASMLEHDPMLGYEVVGFVDDNEDEGNGRVLGPIAHTLRVVRETGASSVIVAATAMNVDTTNRLVRVLLREGIHVELSSTLRDIAAQRLTVRPLGRYPIVYLEPCEASGWRAFAKRAFDITVASVCIVATVPITALIALAIRLESKGPVIYKQRRVGQGGEVFEFKKFRSMVDGAHDLWIDLREKQGASGPIFKLKDDPRITRVGRILRKTSLDELPQLWNVLRGEMSLVGPRPALPEEMVMWEGDLHDRLRVRPGITGMWQVSGRSDADVAAYTRLDLYYVDNWSLFTDLIIMLKTVPVVLFGRGAY
jgi:exopolysaccharide biosynthesis polyprenyl glycosylphosphotransferase